MKIHGEKYIKRPVIIEAVELRIPNTPEDIADWCGGKVCGIGEKVWIEIPTLEGTMRANYGDFIIKGVAEEFYPCKPNIFYATYVRQEP